MTGTPAQFLTDSQRAAAAKLACCLARPGGTALLCGPRGVGKTTVLRHVAEVLATRHGPVDIVPAEAAETLLAETLLPAAAQLPAIILLDDAHLAVDGLLGRLASRCRDRRPAAGLVLAGAGRLLTAVARDARLEPLIGMRVVLPPWSREESRRFVSAALPRSADDDGVVTTLHEIAAGIPAAARRLADLAAVLAATRPDGRVTADDIETIHRRLCPRAA